MAKNKKQKDPNDLDEVFGADDMEIKCKHCGETYILDEGYDDKYCSQECMEADQDE